MRFLVLILVACVPAAFAHDVISTKLLWTQEISRIVYRHCAVCHHEGGSAPMSLMTYKEARPWAKAIRDEVLERRMPPWGAVKGVGEFRNDPSLSQIEIDMVVNWVEGGAPEGDEMYLPPAPHFEKPNVPPAGRQIAVGSDSVRTIGEDVLAAGIRPLRLAPGASLDVAVAKPDGGVEHLIWIRNWRPEWERTYFFAHPVRLPQGARIALYSGKAAEAAILIDHPN